MDSASPIDVRIDGSTASDDSGAFAFLSMGSTFSPVEFLRDWLAASVSAVATVPSSHRPRATGHGHHR